MEYPVTGLCYPHIKAGNVIKAPLKRGGAPQPFRIESVSRPIGGLVTVSARSIFCDLENMYKADLYTYSLEATLQSILRPIGEWEDNDEQVFQARVEWTPPVPYVHAILSEMTRVSEFLFSSDGGLAEYVRGEWSFDDLTLVFQGIIGEDRGVQIRYGKNIIDFKQEELLENAITHVIPYTRDEDGGYYGYTSGVSVPGMWSFPYHAVAVDFTDELGQEDDETTLNDAASSYIAEHQLGVPEVSIDLVFVQLSDTEEYKDTAFETVELGDTVSVIFERNGVDTSARVTETTYDAILDKMSKVHIGAKARDLTDTIAEMYKAEPKTGGGGGGGGGEPLFEEFINDGGAVGGDLSAYGDVTVTRVDDTYGLMPSQHNWNSIGRSNRQWYNGYINNLYVGGTGTDVNSRLLALEGGTCLIEGTKILMSDGSEKNIEDVKTGELIKSYDITTGKPVEAMCLMTRYTGAAVQYDALVFDDGSSAEFYGTHSIYCNEIRRLKEVGKWEVGLHSLDANGNPIELSIKTKTKHHARPKHYILISSNNLYYANGILMGHLTSTKYQETEGLGLPKGITDRYKERLKDSDDEDQMALRPEFLSKAKEIMAEKHKLTADCEKEQALLDGTDYSVIKTCERFLAAFRNINLLNIAKSLGELRGIIGDMGEARREEIRGKLDLKKDRLSEVTRQYNAFRREYRKKIKLSKFEDSVTQGNEDLPALKEWAKTIKKKNK